MYGYIYKFTFIPTLDWYVGKHKYLNGQDLDPNYGGSGTEGKNLISQYDKEEGPNLIKREIIEWCETKEQLNEREIYWVAKLNAINEGLNISPGGDGGDIFWAVASEEEKEACISKRKQYYIDHPDVYEKLCEINRLNQLGSKKSDETRKKISDKQKASGSNNYDEKIKTCMSGLHNEEVYTKISNGQKRHYDNMSDEDREQLKIQSSKRWDDPEYRRKQTLARQSNEYKEKGSTKHPGKGTKTLYNKILDKEVHVKPEDIDKYIEDGYVLGRRPFFRKKKKDDIK